METFLFLFPFSAGQSTLSCLDEHLAFCCVVAVNYFIMFVEKMINVRIRRFAHRTSKCKKERKYSTIYAVSYFLIKYGDIMNQVCMYIPTVSKATKCWKEPLRALRALSKSTPRGQNSPEKQKAIPSPPPLPSTEFKAIKLSKYNN